MSTAAPALARFAWMSIAAALVTMGLKLAAWLLTGSVGFLSDAAESVVNLMAAVIALVVLRFAAQPPDAEHQYGHEKAEYMAAGVEGALILLAAASIAWAAIGRLLNPEPLENVQVGVTVSAIAAAVNLVVALRLIRVGRAHRSIALEADGKHLMADVWTSVGVVAGVAAVGATGWDRLDPIIALAVAANIVVTGYLLIHRSTGGLMDRALPAADLAAVEAVLDRHRLEGVEFHAIRTRQAGRRSFVSMHVLVPGAWSVQRGHDLAERVERDVRQAVPHATVFTHIEPVEDPSSFADAGLDRAGGEGGA
ncbi:MAG: cation diffusion facilitator family transporter [Actinomycetota bacterium]